VILYLLELSIKWDVTIVIHLNMLVNC